MAAVFDLRELRELKQGWDGYSAGPPTRAALATASLMHCTPMSSEGVLLEMHTDTLSIEITIHESGRVEDISITPRKGK